MKTLHEIFSKLTPANSDFLDSYKRLSTYSKKLNKHCAPILKALKQHKIKNAKEYNDYDKVVGDHINQIMKCSNKLQDLVFDSDTYDEWSVWEYLTGEKFLYTDYDSMVTVVIGE